ncbi:MAG: hypothetical protein IJ638_01740 [Alphaproteobacteria bacterium]|nr:hypothetical protein [Alphaproteobacteria bacterium]
MKFRIFPLLFCFAFAFTPYAYSADEVEEEEEMDVEEDTIGEDGEEEEYEDYVEEGSTEEITSELNDRVKYFDVAGVMIGQDYDQVKEALKERKYKLVNVEYDIPKYFRYNYDALCRKRNIFIPENLKACIKGFAKKDKMEYISKVNYKKHDTKEEISIYFTSPITENKVWKIEYKNDLNIKYGDSENFQYQREERRRAFWYFVLSKYGEPNVEPNKWILDTNDNYSTNLEAGFGTLTLSNPKQNAFDILEAAKQARREFKYTDYTF